MRRRQRAQRRVIDRRAHAPGTHGGGSRPSAPASSGRWVVAHNWGLRVLAWSSKMPWVAASSRHRLEEIVRSLSRRPACP